MIYPTLKLLHIISSTILFGGGIFAALLVSYCQGRVLPDDIVRACTGHHWIVDGVPGGISGFDWMARVGLDATFYGWPLLDPWCLAAASHD